MIQFHVQTPGHGAAILGAYRRLASSVRFDRMTGLFAFASFKGTRLLCESLGSDVANWGRVSKRWVVSVDGGITEPEALRFLLRQRRTELWVPNADAVLARNLRPLHRFHPKSLLLEKQTTVFEPTGLLVGSANMTCSGLCFGFEHAVSVELTPSSATEHLPPDILQGVLALEQTISEAARIDQSFIDRYDLIRQRLPRIENEFFEDPRANLILQDRPTIDLSEAISLASAQNLWVDIEYVVQNRGANEEGNQIDLKRGTRVFFGFGDASLSKNSPIGTVQIRFGSHAAARNLRFGNNSMDKLDLPIPVMEGPPSYKNQTLLFTKASDGTFTLTLGTQTDIGKWKQKSREANSLFTMRSGREYGVF